MNHSISNVIWVDRQVSWVEQQYEKKRTKRDFTSSNRTPRQVGSSNFALGKGSEFPDPAYAEQWYLVSLKFSITWNLYGALFIEGKDLKKLKTK